MATNNALKQSADLGQMAGFRNMLSKENSKWWRIKPLAAQLIIWLVLLNAMVAVILFIVPGMVNNAVIEANITDESGQTQAALDAYASPHEVANMGMALFFELAGFAVFIGAVIFSHDAILKERESGTAAWLLSKPLSRRAFVLSKVLAIAAGVMFIVLFAQGVIAYAMCSVEQGSPMPVLPFLEGICVTAIGVMFYLTLAIMLGAFTLSRGLTLGLPLVIGIVGGLVLQVLQMVDALKVASYVVPWSLTSYASSLATGASLAADQYWPWPVLATAVWAVLFVVIAITRFDNIEL